LGGQCFCVEYHKQYHIPFASHAEHALIPLFSYLLFTGKFLGSICFTATDLLCKMPHHTVAKEDLWALLLDQVLQGHHDS